jgi:hypothetical protein
MIKANKNCYGDGFLYEDGEVVSPCHCKKPDLKPGAINEYNDNSIIPWDNVVDSFKDEMTAIKKPKRKRHILKRKKRA